MPGARRGISSGSEGWEYRTGAPGDAGLIFRGSPALQAVDTHWDIPHGMMFVIGRRAPLAATGRHRHPALHHRLNRGAAFPS